MSETVKSEKYFKTSLMLDEQLWNKFKEHCKNQGLVVSYKLNALIKDFLVEEGVLDE